MEVYSPLRRMPLLLDLFLLLSKLSMVVQGHLPHGLFVAVSSSGLSLTSYKTQSFGSCARCSVVCLNDQDRLETCHGFRCDSASNTKTCTFYTKGNEKIPHPGDTIFLFQAHDVFHTVSRGGQTFNVYLSSAAANFASARAACNNLGGYLVEFETWEEHEAVKDVTYRQTKGTAIIGLTYQNTKGSYVTDRQGAPTSSGAYTWRKGEPSSPGSENCVEVNVFSLGMNDYRCDVKLRYLCEKDGA